MPPQPNRLGSVASVASARDSRSEAQSSPAAQSRIADPRRARTEVGGGGFAGIGAMLSVCQGMCAAQARASCTCWVSCATAQQTKDSKFDSQASAFPLCRHLCLLGSMSVRRKYGPTLFATDLDSLATFASAQMLTSLRGLGMRPGSSSRCSA